MKNTYDALFLYSDLIKGHKIFTIYRFIDHGEYQYKQEKSKWNNFKINGIIIGNA